LLRAIDYRDADKIVTLLTADAGRVSALARGARRSRKRFGGALEPYSLLQVEIGVGRGSLDRLAQATVSRPFSGILSSLRKMTLAGSAMEVIRRATPENEADLRAFQTAVELLEKLAGADDAVPAYLYAFTLRFFAVTGLAPCLDECFDCGKRCADGQAGYFDVGRGSLVCRGCGGGALLLSGPARAAALAALERSWWPSQPWSDSVTQSIGQLVYQFAATQLGRPLELADSLARVDSAVSQATGRSVESTEPSR
jgi:DNA repair protein RecO (recombination protein O)